MTRSTPSFTCNSTAPMLTSHSSVPNKNGSVSFGIANIEEEISAYFNLVKDLSH